MLGGLHDVTIHHDGWGLQEVIIMLFSPQRCSFSTHPSDLDQ